MLTRNSKSKHEYKLGKQTMNQIRKQIRLQNTIQPLNTELTLAIVRQNNT